MQPDSTSRTRTCSRSSARSSRAALAREESRGTHTRLDFPEPLAARSTAAWCSSHGLDARRSCRCPDRSSRGARAVNGSHEFDPPRARRASTPSRARSPRTSARSATSPPRSCRTTTRAVADFVARADGVLAGTACATETFAQLDPSVRVTLGRGRRRRDRARASRSAGSRARCGRSSPASAPRSNFLCHLSGIATLTRQFVDARRRRARRSETRKTLPGLRALEKAAVRAGGGSEPPRLPVRLGAGQGQPPRRARPSPPRCAEPASCGRAAASRSSATAPTRWRRRSRPASTSCCSTT